jgi:hypothetical protein
MIAGMAAGPARALVIALAVAGCTSTQPPEPRAPPTSEPHDPTTDGRCGALSYGIHHRSGDTLETIAQRTAGTIACATVCGPKPAFATSPLARNEHGGYGFLDVAPDACQFPGMQLPIADCHATCEGQDRLGRLEVDTHPASDATRAVLCREFVAQRGPPSVGSCACLDDDIVWLPTPTLAGVVLHFKGTYTLDCGFPGANYTPTREPG